MPIRSMVTHHPSHSWIVCAVVLAAGLGIALDRPASADGPGDEIGQLTEEQAHIANDMSAFMAHMEESLFQSVARASRQMDVESKDFDLDHGDYVVKVARGEVIEKAGLYTGHSHTEVPGRLRETVWNRYLHMDLHPETPLVGLLHITMTLQFMPDGTSMVGGNMHMARAAGKEEDFQNIRERIDEAFARYDIDPTRYREARCKGSRKENDLVVCAGVSFYSPPFLEANETNYKLVRDVFEASLDAFVDVVEKRKDEPYTEAELALQDEMRRKWLWDRVFSDPFTTSIVPYELYSFATLPPEVKF